ncbi:MAG: hypothetical protein JST00_19365 [Deltaproteobacteria bacterium]|nr:hypothetical protein [Deltaproteobacteria bacterium]
MMKPWPPWLALLVGASGIVGTQPGCLSCSEVVATERASAPVSEGKTSLAEGGAFLFEGKRYASCSEFCNESGVFLDVDRCDAPRVAGGFLELSCTGVRASCKDIVSLGSGRYTAGLEAPALPRDLAGYFAYMTHGEAAAVHSFRRLAEEMARFGAPGWLVERCRQAEADERRHVRAFRRLWATALASGAPSSSRPSIEVALETADRDLEHVLAENVIEGCFGETVGALVLLAQSRRAPDRRARATFRAIACDEASHADTSLLIARAFPDAMRSPSVLAAIEHATTPREPSVDPFRHLDQEQRRAIGAPTPSEYEEIVRRVQTWLASTLAPAEACGSAGGGTREDACS